MKSHTKFQSANQHLLASILKKADGLGALASKGSFPVILRHTTERRKVTAVEFKPLLTDALLTTHDEGFRIFLDPGAHDPGSLRAQYERESGQSPLPNRIRFSLSHELAHTFFYDLDSGRPQETKEFKAGGGATALENLERYCNRIAGHLLLPSNLFRKEVYLLGSLKPKELIGLSGKTGASIETIISRLGEEQTVLNDRESLACVAVVDKCGTDFTLKVIARPGFLLAKEIGLMQPGEKWQLHLEDGTPVITGVEGTLEVSLTIETKSSSERRKHQVFFQRYTTFGSTDRYCVYVAMA